MLIQEETQKNFSTGQLDKDIMAMSVKHYAQVNGRAQQSRFSNANSVAICDYCRMTGHLKEKYYCLHGYPSWHRLHRKPKRKPRSLSKKSVAAQVSKNFSAGNQSTIRN